MKSVKSWMYAVQLKMNSAKKQNLYILETRNKYPNAQQHHWMLMVLKYQGQTSFNTLEHGWMHHWP